MLLLGRLMFGVLLLISSLCTFADELLRERIDGWSAGYPAHIAERPINNAESLQTFYEQNRYEPLWLYGDSPTPLRLFNPPFAVIHLNKKAEQLLQAIANTEAEGLIPQDYHSRYLQPTIFYEPELSSIEYDILLTDAFLTLAQHLLVGKVNPEGLTPEWKTQKRTVDAAMLLKRVQTEDVVSLLATLRPPQPRYARLSNARARLRLHTDKNWAPLNSGWTLKPGAADPHIPALRERLIFWGDLGAHNESVYFDDELIAAVKQFQWRHGLAVDGLIGKETVHALNISVAQRIKDITVNMERWRWLGDHFGERFVVVNIAAFDLRIYENDKKIFETPVIVGQNYRRTPVFSDLIRYLVFNPTWTVPHKLAVEDKLAEIRMDPNYLKRMGFTLYHLGSSQMVDPATIDWSSLAEKKFPFRMVQAPGPLNALGQVKFMFPNPYDVYLHDTPARDYFKKSERAFSSGCIRVAEPLTLAQILLASPAWDAQHIQAVLATGETTTVFLDQPVPIHIEYWTAWVDSDDKMHFRKDIYGRDPPLWRALTQVTHYPK